MIGIHSDEPVVQTVEHLDGMVKHIIHLDAQGQIVRTEIHGFSKLKQEHEQTTRTEYKADPAAAEEIGFIDWEITDGKTSEVLSQGRGAAYLRDVTVEVVEGPSKKVA